MDYSIYKDCSVIDTVDRIKKILDEVGLETEEKISSHTLPGQYKPYSIRLNMFGIKSLGTNGKGTTLDNAKASAYAEFMERLQNQFKVSLNNNKFFKAPDEKVISVDDIKKYSTCFLNANTEELLSEYKLFSCTFPGLKEYADDKKIICYPYYNVFDKKVEYLPIFIKLNSNGMCAGNTPEEALVQGLSEICERYTIKKIIGEGIVMPDIPACVYEKYERLKGIKAYIEQYGYEVTVKDASILGLPVVCTVFKHKTEGFFVFNFGCQPSLPIAIERTLTEFAQIENINNIKTFPRVKKLHDFNIYVDEVMVSCMRRTTPIENDEYFDKIFNSNNTDYEFSSSSWVDEQKVYTNKELLRFLIDKIKKIADSNIYVRDVSFLGFPGYYIYIPGVSDLLHKYYYNNISKKILLYKWFQYTRDNVAEHDNIDSLIEALDFKINIDDSILSSTRDTFICTIPHEYLIMLCYMVTKDTNNVIKYAKIILDKNIMNDRVLIEIILKYYETVKDNKNKNKIENILSFNFSSNDIKRFIEFREKLTFKYIKDMISDNNMISIKQKEYREERDKKIQEATRKIKKVKEKIIDIYIKNTPNQEKLRDVFEEDKL